MFQHDNASGGIRWSGLLVRLDNRVNSNFLFDLETAPLYASLTPCDIGKRLWAILPLSTRKFRLIPCDAAIRESLVVQPSVGFYNLSILQTSTYQVTL
jgi:hypothetical protein